MRLLYVADFGRVRRGLLTRTEGGVQLTTAGGSKVSPGPGLVLLAPPDATEDERAMIWRAVEAGYRVEDA